LLSERDDWRYSVYLRLGLVFPALARKMMDHCTGVAGMLQPKSGATLLRAMLVGIPMTQSAFTNVIGMDVGQFSNLIKNMDRMQCLPRNMHSIADGLLKVGVPREKVYEWVLAVGLWPQHIPIEVWESAWCCEPELRQQFQALAWLSPERQQGVAAVIRRELWDMKLEKMEGLAGMSVIRNRNTGAMVEVPVCGVCRQPLENMDGRWVHVLGMPDIPHSAVTAEEMSSVRDDNRVRQIRIRHQAISDMDGDVAAECGNCRFFFARSKQDGQPSKSGECRAHPSANAPKVPVDFWCGEWSWF
jgi:hypothetical protein